MSLGISEVFSYGTACVRSDVLHRRGIRSGSGNHDRVIHGPVLFQYFHHLRNRRAFLPDCDIDADHILSTLVDDRVQGNRGLAGLPVADDELALAAPDRDHGVDRLDSGLQRLLDGLPVYYARRQALQGIKHLCFNRPLAIDWSAQRIHNTADQGFSHRNRDDPPGAFHRVTLFDVAVIAKQHNANLIFFQIEGDANGLWSKFDKLARHDILQAVNACNTVTNADYRSCFRNVRDGIEILNFRTEYARNFVCSDVSHPFPFKNLLMQ